MPAKFFDRISPGHFAILLLMMTAALGIAGRGMQEVYPVFVLPLAGEFGWTRAAISSVYATSFLVVGFSGPLIGWCFDRFGPLAVYATGIILVAVGAISATFASALWQFVLVLGVVLGLGSAAVGLVVSASLISRWFRDRLNLALAVAQSSYGGGILIMAPSAQLLIDWQGWRTAYWIFTAAMLCLLPLLFVMPWKRAVDGHPNFRRQSLPTETRPEPSQGPTLGQALKSPIFWGIIWSFTFTGTGMYAVSLQVPAYLVSIGYSPQGAADAFGFVGFLLPIGVIGFGWLSDRIGRRNAMALAYSLSIIGMLCLLGLRDGPSTFLLALFVVTYGGTFGSRGPALLTIAAHAFQGPQIGRIYGAVTIGMGGGGAIGSWLGGFLLDLTGDYLVGLYCGMVSLVFAFLPFLAVRQMVRS